MRGRLTGTADGVLDVLASASRALDGPGGYRAALETLTSLLVPAYAQASAIALFDESGRLRLAASYGDDAGENLALRRVPREPVTSVDGRQWSVDMPIAARGETFGLFRVLGQQTQRMDVAVAVAEELARRLGAAIDHANAIDREHRLAQTLQRALLPERLPKVATALLDAAYLPASGESTVGGDWYDAFELPDGRIGLSVGDVAGHGLSAAAVMGNARHAVRASAFASPDPSDVLARANQALNTAPMMVTALFGVFDPRRSTLTYATAGHPPPIVYLPDGHTCTLPIGDLPLGVEEALRPVSWTFTLQPGSLIVLYTDGIVEYERDLMLGERKLLKSVSDEMRQLTSTPAKSIQARIFEDVRNNDDVATLTLYVPPRARESFECVFSAVPFAAPYVRASLAHFLQERGIDADRRFAVLTAVGEAVANAVEHAYAGAPGTARLTVQEHGGSVEIEIEDTGGWRATKKTEDRGRGIPIMRALMDRVEIRTDRSRTEIRMRLKSA